MYSIPHKGWYSLLSNRRTFNAASCNGFFFFDSLLICLHYFFPPAPAKAPEFENWSASNVEDEKRDVILMWKVLHFFCYVTLSSFLTSLLK